MQINDPRIQAVRHALSHAVVITDDSQTVQSKGAVQALFQIEDDAIEMRDRLNKLYGAPEPFGIVKLL